MKLRRKEKIVPFEDENIILMVFFCFKILKYGQ